MVEEKNEEENKSKDLKEIRIDFIKKRLGKEDKNSLDVFSIFYHIISLSNNREFVRENFERLRDIVSRGGNQNELGLFIQDLRSSKDYEEIKNIDFGNGYTTDNFLDEYSSSLPRIFSDFDRITGQENSLDFATADYVCNRDLMMEMWPEYSEDIARWDKAYVTSKDNELNLEVAKIRVRESQQEVEKYNNGISPENGVEITKDAALITATAIGAAFPPLLIVTGILFLLRANNNELIGKFVESAGKKEKELLGSLKESERKESQEKLGDFVKKIDGRLGQVQKLESCLPRSLGKVVGAATSPNANLYKKFARLRAEREKLMGCDKEQFIGQSSGLGYSQTP